VTAGNADETFGVGFVVIAEQPITWVGVVLINVGDGEGFATEADWGEQEPRTSIIINELMNIKNVFMVMYFP
jgi:hypothetical protein